MPGKMNKKEYIEPRIYSQLKQNIALNIEYLIYLLLFVALIFILKPHNFNHSIIDMDEIWNYQYARRIFYGQIPYRDFVMLQTPFSAQLNAFFLYLFGDRLIVLRWAGSFLMALNGVVTYKILRVIGKNHLVALGYTCMLSSLFLLYPHNNYSWTVVLFLSAALMFELFKINKFKKEQIYYEIFIGLALGLATITKQNIGLAGLLASIVFLFYHSRDIGNKYLIHSISLKLVGWSIVVGFEIIYLSSNTNIIQMTKNIIINLYQFTSSSSISYINLIFSNLFIALVALSLPIIILSTLIKGIQCEDTKIKTIKLVVSLYALANLTMIFPRADIIHIIFGMPIAIIAGSLLFYQKDNSRNTSSITASILIFSLLLVFIMNIHNERERTIDNEIRHYESIYLPQELRNQITKIDQLILAEQAAGKTVYVLNYQAELYLIPLDQFSYKYDTISSGSTGEKDIIELLSSTRNNAVIISSGDEIYGQESQGLKNYVRENMQYESSLEGFDVYSD
jgi:hypothetical protein